MTKEGFPLPAQVRTTRLFPGHTPRFSEINVTPSRLLSLDKKGYGIWQTPPPTTFHKNPSFELAPLLPIMIMTITIVIMNLSIEMVEHDMGGFLQQGWIWLVTHVPVQHHLPVTILLLPMFLFLDQKLLGDL